MKQLTIPRVGVAYPTFFGSFAKYIPGLEIVDSLDKVKDMDLIIFTGGEDISPSIYGQSINGSYGINPIRDKWESSVFKLARTSRKKTFGVCRGHQLICALMGGNLYQDMRRDLNVSHPSYHPLSWTANFDPDDSGIARLKKLFPERFEVNSMHHQAVERSPGQSVILRADTIVEATYSPTCFTVQFHPEFMKGMDEFFHWVSREWVTRSPRKLSAVKEEQTDTLSLARKNIMKELAISDLYLE
jgi:putative glutamine amidotransferase